MINRRRFVQHGVAGSVTALVGGIPVLAGAATSEFSRATAGLLGDGLLRDNRFQRSPQSIHCLPAGITPAYFARPRPSIYRAFVRL